MKTVIIDGCSICYASACAEHLPEAIFTFDKYISEIKRNCQTEKMIGFTESPVQKNIFRFHIACTKPYKGNRKGRDKPPFLREVKEHARDHHGWIWTTVVEAEDAMICTANEMGLDNVIMAYCDKDVLQSPGLFYNYFKQEFIKVTEDQADYNLWHQILTGDASTDNVPGIPQIGKAKATKILDGIPMGERHIAVARAYKEHPMPYAYLIEQARLIYLLRSKGDIFTPVSKEIWDNL